MIKVVFPNVLFILYKNMLMSESENKSHELDLEEC